MTYPSKLKERQIAKDARRRVEFGFPIHPRALTADEVELYFSTEKIVCLICGKAYRMLAKHLGLHDLDTDKYRAMYGLPWSRGLCCPETYDVLAARVIEDGRFEKMFAKSKPGWQARVRPIQPFAREKAAKRASARMKAFHQWSRERGDGG